LLEAIRDRVHLVSAEALHITASVGVAELEAGTTAAAALAAADLAMYEAKRTGRDHVVVFTRELNAGADSVRSWAEEIRSALDRDRFQLYFQPIVDLRTGAVAQYDSCCACVVSATTSSHPHVPGRRRAVRPRPGDRPVGVGKAVRLIADRRKAGTPLRVAVNLSASSIGDPTLTRFLQRELGRDRANPDDLVLEVTESAATPTWTTRETSPTASRAWAASSRSTTSVRGSLPSTTSSTCR
jgi:predicted signal transduction protein with EAL and GGDEF domain